jgi:hypothetical protein
MKIIPLYIYKIKLEPPCKILMMGLGITVKYPKHYYGAVCLLITFQWVLDPSGFDSFFGSAMCGCQSVTLEI